MRTLEPYIPSQADPDQSQSIEHDVQFLEHFFGPLPPDRIKPKVSDKAVIPVFRKIREFSVDRFLPA